MCVCEREREREEREREIERERRTKCVCEDDQAHILTLSRALQAHVCVSVSCVHHLPHSAHVSQ